MGSTPDLVVIFDAIEAALKDVKEAGRVHERPRDVIFDKELRDLFLDDDKVFRTTLLRMEASPEFEDEATDKFFVLWKIGIFHYLEFNEQENSFRGFRKEIQAIRDKFRRLVSVFGTPERPETQRCITNVTPDLVELGDLNVHEAKFELTVEATETVTV